LQLVVAIVALLAAIFGIYLIFLIGYKGPTKESTMGFCRGRVGAATGLEFPAGKRTKPD